MAQPGAPQGWPDTTAGSKPIANPGLPRSARLRSTSSLEASLRFAPNRVPASRTRPPARSHTRYDLYGNIQTVLTDGVALSTTTDAATNHLIGTGTAYADGRGNLTSRAGVTFTYDALDRLVRRHASGDTRESLFFYTADDERILTFENEPPGSGLEERFHWTLRDLGGTVLRDYTSVAAGATQILCAAVDYVHRGAALLGAREHSCDPDGSPTPADTHYTSDHLGTPRLLTLASGAIAEERKYFPYGEEAKPANPEGPRLRFTGHERDPFDLAGTGDDLDYLHARFSRRSRAGSSRSIRSAGVRDVRNPGIDSHTSWAIHSGSRIRPASPLLAVVLVGLST